MHSRYAYEHAHVYFQVTAMATCPVSGSGGFDYDFLEEVSVELKCSICLQVLREPFTVMLDKLCARKVNSIRVKCPNTTGGCVWTGSSGGPRSMKCLNCQYRIVPCEFIAIGCKAVVTFNKMHEHLGATSGAHLSLVMASMCVKDKRILELEQKVSNHQLEIDCLREEVGLPVGTSHAKSPPPEASATTPAHASRAHSPLPSPPGFSGLYMYAFLTVLAADRDDDDGDFLPVDLIMHDVMYAGNTQCSEPFYSHPGSRGYKMCLTVFINGVGRGTGTHVSVFA